MKHFFTTLMLIAAALAGTGSVHSAARAYRAPDPVTLSRAGLPTEQMAKAVLSAALKDRHPQWNDIPVGSTKIPAFTVFPDRTDRAPVLVVSAKDQGMTDWVRAVAD